jgi:hypothetical protein
MKTTTENGDAITRAMDWLGQLREDGYAEPAFEGGGEPTRAAGRHETVAEPAETAAEPPVSFAGPPETYAGPPETYPGTPETYAGPPGTYAQPRNTYADPRKTYADSRNTYADPRNTYADPRNTYADPRKTYADPRKTYADPRKTYADPRKTYAGPSETYAEPPMASPVALPNGTSSGSGSSESQEIPEPAPIGDELRIPTAWCEMDSCISHYAHPAALGEVDNRSRAIAAGWRIDALGRLACPQCQQGPWFWATQALAPWDRGRAVAMATLMTAVVRADDRSGPDGRAESAVIPAADQALVPLPPDDRR